MGIIICPCQRCNQDIQFGTDQFKAGEEVECPHCHKATTLFVPQIAQPAQIPPKPKIISSIAWFSAGIMLTVILLAVGAVLLHPTNQPKTTQDSTPQALLTAQIPAPVTPTQQASPTESQNSQPPVVQNDPLATGNLMSAIQYGGTPDTVKLLLTKGADANAQDNEGWHALQLAAKRGDVKIVQLLLDNGADVDATNLYGAGALISAASRGYIDIVRLLVEKGANINIQERDYETPLMAAIEGGQTNTVMFLGEKGADVNATNDSGDSVLMEAADAGEIDVAKLLLSKGANINAENIMKNNALDKATDKGNHAMVDLLRQAGATKSSASRQDDDMKTILDQLVKADPGITNVPGLLPALPTNLQIFRR
jgi:hypothetical protein